MSVLTGQRRRQFAASARGAADLLRALANESRLRILCALELGETSVGDLQVRVGLSQSALSQHLAVLRAQGLVGTRRDAQRIYYHIADPAVVKVIATLASIYCPETSR